VVDRSDAVRDGGDADATAECNVDMCRCFHYNTYTTIASVPQLALYMICVYTSDREIWLPDAVNVIYDLTTLFRLPMRQKAIRPSNYPILAQLLTLCSL
jgi:hypothetical protein